MTKLVVLLVSLISAFPALAARCDPSGVDAAALAAVWTSTDAQCPCAGASSRGTYVKCAGTVLKTAVTGGTLPSACKKAAKQRAALSTCGRPGAAVCCRTMSNGIVKGRIVGDASRCRAPSGGAACVSPETNVVDGCSAGGCVGCGNGVVEHGEDCEPPNTATCSDTCTATTCLPPPSGATAVACLTSQFAAPSIAAGDESFLLAWDEPVNGTGSVVRAQRFDAAASPVDALPITVSDPDDDYAEERPLVAGDAGGWYVAWFATSLPFFSIDALHMTPDGELEARHNLGSGAAFGTCQTGSTGPSALAAEGDGQFAVAFLDYAVCAGGPMLYGHHADRAVIADGGATVSHLGTPDPIEFGHRPDPITDIPVDIAHAGDDTVMVLTQVHVVFNPLNDYGIWAYWLPVPGGATRLSSAATVSASGVAVGGSDAQFLAAWSASSGGGTTKVRALRFTRADGALDADGGIVLANGVSPLGRPVVVFDGATWLVAWLDGTPPGPYDVRGVRLQPNGTVVDATPRLLASRVAGIAPALASAGSGWLLAVVRPAGTGWWSLDAVPVTP